MSEVQRAIETLLLATGASRAMLQLRRDGAGAVIAAEAVQHDQPQLRHSAAPSVIGADAPAGVKAQMQGSLARGGREIGAIVLHDCVEARQWSASDRAMMEEAQARILHLLELPESAAEALAVAAIQGVLDRLRQALDVKRCTFRQSVQAAYAFPVTFESRDTQVRSLL